MWGLFFIAAIVAVLFTYLPGYFLFRSIRVPRLVGLICAPLATVVAYGALSVAYAKAGVFTTWLALFAPSLALGLVTFAISCFLNRKRTADFGLESPARTLSRAFDWKCLLLYVGIGIAVTLFVYVRSLDGPESFVQEFDNVHHLGSVYGFVQSGNWSPLEVTLYPLASEAAFNPLPGIEFYPSAWHCTAAMLVSSLGVSVPLAENVVNFLFTAIVFPSAMFLLMRRLFRERPRAVLFGAFCTLAFSAFPWGFLFFGPLYSNLSSFAVLPAVVFCFVSIFSERVDARSRATSAVLFLVGVISLALTQPNAVFTMGVFLIPFCVVRAVRIADFAYVAGRRRTLLKIALGVGFLLLVAVLWFALFKAPFMQKVVTHEWPGFASKSQSVIDVLTLAFNVPAVQLVLAALVLTGIAYSLYRRQYLWLSCAFFLFGALYVVDAASDGYLKFLLTGFWYTDSYRVAASAAFAAIPLAGLGLSVISSIANTGLSWLSDRMEAKRPHAWAAPCVVAVLFLGFIFYPSFTLAGRYELHTAFGFVTEKLTFMNDASRSNIYAPNERDFVRKVLQEVPAGTVIINEPNDGSAFAYGTDGLDAYYRHLRTYGGGNETAESKAIRKSLNDIAVNDQVRLAVQRSGARYLLQLDQGDAQMKEPYPFTYRAEDWIGINAVNDETPGFEVVLSDGDMRLYKITAAS
ncbi:DUF6541 family protein [Gordonibacter massiliensis (ex Traore et al. 2017)]|uniref:ATP-binding protein n=1 Tax=Gordonibacter massiliensis (ex Traore et al. 2017) TaxID=1841863 RepID=A0A842JIL3_9ACTN|nr:DUF6541 family protein [Gordonibacter massiliensis (ex Traore et al. 2017)]MBC2890321.1 ATP-binding protein [Gordonibacter massiliensis (ex Traore et al. 2017)]